MSSTPSAPNVLVFIAPADATGGVGDYAEHVLGSVRGMFDVVREIRTNGPGDDAYGDIRRWRKELRRIEKEYGKGNVTVHAELSSGSVGPLWVLRASRSPRRTAVIHDAPFPVWWPIRTSEIANLIGRHWRIALWYDRFERRVLGRMLRSIELSSLKGVAVFALSDIGAEKIREVAGSAASVGSIRHYVPTVPTGEIVPIADRPRAVGLFGHVYGGKGFELLSHLRIEIPDEIEIRIAGRGTAALPKMRGVTLLGEVDGQSERDFFNSIRLLVLPYNRRVGLTRVYPASGAAARAFAFHTPAVSSMSGTFEEASKEGGLVAREDIDDISQEVVALVDDVERLERLQAEAAGLAETRTLEASLAPLTTLWAGWTSVR